MANQNNRVRDAIASGLLEEGGLVRYVKRDGTLTNVGFAFPDGIAFGASAAPRSLRAFEEGGLGAPPAATRLHVAAAASLPPAADRSALPI